MNKFFNKLICGILSLTISCAPVKMEAGVISNVTKLVINSIGFLLALYARNELNVYKNINDDRIKYAYIALGIFGTNLILDGFQLKHDIHDSGTKEKLEKKINKLEIENTVLKATRK